MHCQAMEIFKQALKIEMQLCRSSSLGKREYCFTGWRVCSTGENNFLYLMLIWMEKLSQIAIWSCLGQKIWKSTNQCRISSLIYPVLGKGQPWIFPESIQDPELGTKKERHRNSFLISSLLLEQIPRGGWICWQLCELPRSAGLPGAFSWGLLQGISPLLIQCGQSWDTTAESIKTNLNLLTAAILLLIHQVDM